MKTLKTIMAVAMVLLITACGGKKEEEAPKRNSTSKVLRNSPTVTIRMPVITRKNGMISLKSMRSYKIQ